MHSAGLAGDCSRHAPVIEVLAGELDVVLRADEAGGQSEDEGSILHFERDGGSWNDK